MLEVAVDGGASAPVLVKDLQRHPVRGEAVHVDLLRVDMKVAIQTHVTLELTRRRPRARRRSRAACSRRAPSRSTSRRSRATSPTCSGSTSPAWRWTTRVTLSQLTAPAGVTLLDDPEETVLATITPPTKEPSRRRSRPRPSSSARAARPPRARRGRGRSRRGGRAVGLRRVLKLFSSAPVDWLIVGLGNPGRRYDDTPHNVGFQVADALIAALGPAASRRRSSPASSPRGAPARAAPRVAVLKPQTYMNDSGRSVGPARGSYKLDLDRVLVDARRDRPAVRRHPRAPRRRARRPQRPQVAQARARQRGLPARAHRRRPARHDRSRRSSPPTSSASGARARPRCASSSSARATRPSGSCCRIRWNRSAAASSHTQQGGCSGRTALVWGPSPCGLTALVRDSVKTCRRDWDAATYERLSAPMTAMGTEVLDRLVLRGDETVSMPAAGRAT